MNLSFKLKSLETVLFFSTLTVNGVVIYLLFSMNLPLSSDYFFHLHEAWAISKGFFTVDPFLSGGSHILFQYGYPVKLIGGVLLPFFGRYTVAVLLSASLPLLWISSKKVFEQLFSKRKATRSACLVLLNPLTLFYVTSATLPFLWGTVFALISIYFFLKERNKTAILLSIVAVITHPLSIFLLASVLLVKPEYRRWIKTYILSSLIFLGIMGIFFGLFQNFWTNTSFLTRHPFYSLRVVVIISALILSYLILNKTRKLSAIALGILLGWVILASFGFWIPVTYLDRLGFFVFLMIIPFLLSKTSVKLEVKHFLIIPVVVGLALAPVLSHYSSTDPDQPARYENENLRNEIRDILGDNYVRYASSGSDLQLSEMENIRWSNTVVQQRENPPENKEEYIEMLKEENASFILIGISSVEENIIEVIGFPKVFSKDNITIYEVNAP